MSRDSDNGRNQIDRQKVDQQQIEEKIREQRDRAFNKEITSNDSNVPGDIPQFTSGEGDTAGGQNSGGGNQQQSESDADSSK